MNVKKHFFIVKCLSSASVDIILFYKNLLTMVLLYVYIDDIIFISLCQAQANIFSNLVRNEFEMSMVGESTIILELNVKQPRMVCYYLKLSMLRTIVDKFCLKGTKHAHTPTNTTTPLSMGNFIAEVDIELYRNIIESLLLYMC